MSIESEKLLKLTLEHQKAATNRKDECEAKTLLLSKKQKCREQTNDDIYELEEEITEKRKQLQTVKNELLVHYHGILTEGVDARQEGLCWVIIAIWNLGLNIIPSFLPKYLDDECIKYLFSYAQMEIEYRKAKKDIEDLKENHKTKKNNNNRSTFKTSLIKKVSKQYIQTDIKKKGISIIVDKLNSQQHVDYDKLNYDSIKDLTSSYEEPNDDMKEYMKKLKFLEHLMEEKRKAKELLKNREMVRINREFLLGEYERRYKVAQIKVLTALVGIENAHTEFAKQNKEQKEFHQKLTICKTFNFLEINGNKISKNNHITLKKFDILVSDKTNDDQNNQILESKHENDDEEDDNNVIL